MASKGVRSYIVHTVISMLIIVSLHRGSEFKKLSEIESEGCFDKFTSTIHSMQ